MLKYVTKPASVRGYTYLINSLFITSESSGKDEMTHVTDDVLTTSDSEDEFSLGTVQITATEVNKFKMFLIKTSGLI